MKRTLKYALSAALTAAMVVPAFAQDNFPDTPANHWAYEALARMKRDGLLVGYPDGLFRGSRPASRYELAVAMHAVYTNLKNAVDGLQSQIDALKNQPGANTDDLKNAISALQSDVASLKSYGDDIANLKKMADTFDKELRSLGVDVEALKRDLADLADRVTRLEKRKPAVDISGDVNLLMIGGNSRDNRYGLNKDGRTNGADATGGPVGLTRDLTIMHEAALTLAGTNETGPKWRATLVAGNMLGAGTAGPNPMLDGVGLGDQSSLPLGRYSESATDIYMQDLSVKFDTSLAGLGFAVEAGRLGYKINPYLFQRIDNTTYFANERWDDGMYRFDGAILGFNFGGAKLTAFGGRNSNRLSTNGIEINPMIVANNRIPGEPVGAGNSQIDRSLGLNLSVPLTSAGNLNLAYLWLDSDTIIASPFGAANRVNVFGGDADFSFGAIKVEAGFHQSNLSYNTSNVNDSDNTAWNAQVAYQGSNWRVYGGYREIEVNYMAPGDWGRLGILRNPGNIKGFQVGANIDLTAGLKLEAVGEFDKGKQDTILSFLDTGSKIDSFRVNLGYNLSPNLGLLVGYEDTKFRDLPGVAADPHFRWTTFGIGYGLSSNARLNIAYEISDHENVGGAFANPLGTKFTGGQLTTQLTVKF